MTGISDMMMANNTIFAIISDGCAFKRIHSRIKTNMGRKKKPAETSPIYGSVIVSLLLNSLDFLGAHDQRPPLGPAEQLEKSLQAFLTIPEIKIWAGMILKELDHLSSAAWEKAVLNFAGVCAGLLANMAQAAGEPYPFPNWSLKRIIHYFLKQLGFKWNFKQFAYELRNKLTYYLQGSASGELNPAAFSSEIAGTFKDNPEEALTIIKLCFIASGGQELVAEVDKTVKMLREELHSSKEFEAAVALVEKKYGMGGAQSEQRYKVAWKKLGPKAMARIKGKGMVIPGAYEVDSQNKKTFREEEAIAMSTVHAELVRRATENPLQLITDAKSGRLANYLVTAIENDIWDQIKLQKAKKRGFTRIDRSVDVDDTESRKMRRVLSLGTEEDPAARLIDKETIEEFTEGLDIQDKKIVEMMVEEGLTEKEVALILDKSQSWVSGKVQAIKKKKKPPKQN